MINLWFYEMCRTWYRIRIRIRIWICIWISIKMEKRLRIPDLIKMMPIHNIGTGSSSLMGCVFGLKLCDSFSGHSFSWNTGPFRVLPNICMLPYSWKKCFGYGLHPDSVRPVDPYPDPDPGGRKWPTKILKRWMFYFEDWRLLLYSVALTSFMEA